MANTIERVPDRHDKNKKIILATVKGDVHDIGKNIIKVMLESYGYDVIDLGRDVKSDKIIEKIKESGATLVGLSALMTTTLGAMKETVARIKNECPGCAVMVGGAVLTEEYAKEIGADFYGKDAMEAAKIANDYFA